MRDAYSPSDARDALHAIDPGCCRDTWHQVGRAAIAAGLSLDDLDEWSSRAENYKGTRDVHAAFRTITADGGTGAGTLFMHARNAGWRAPEHERAPEHTKRPSQATSRPAEPPPRPRPRGGAGAAEIWARCKAASNEHPYIVAKGAAGVPLDGLRVVPDDDPLRIAGASVAGWLVVPVMPLSGGEPTSLQFIPPPGAGKKLNLPRAAMTGVFIVGELATAGTAFVCEGVGQAWACWKASGHCAIVTFGCGRMRAVAAELRARDPAARVILCPDVGQEARAEEIAREIGCEYAPLPKGSAPNFDVNDFAQAEGHDALEDLLSRPRKPETEPEEVHPLARFLDLDATPKPPRMVIPGFVQTGVVVVAGAHGAGKTTALVPLAMLAAGLHAAGDPLAPRHWRHVIYIAEDDAQVQRILAGVVGHSGAGIAWADVRERFHVVSALRLPPEDVAAVGLTYRAQFTRIIDGVEVPPLIVIDTKSATLAMADENDNAEAGRVLALFKQQFEALPLWIVGHIAKALVSRRDVQSLSARGASAIEADAHQTLFLIAEEDGRRFLVLGKRRFEPQWPELEIVPGTAAVSAVDEYGVHQMLTLRWGLPRPPQQSRAEAREEAQEAARREATTAMRGAILDAVEQAERQGRPLSRRGVEEAVNGRTAEVRSCIAVLEDEQWLWAVHVPPAQRTNPKRAEFLIRLSDDERRDLIAGRPLPAERVAVPASWRKVVASRPDATEAAEGGE